MTEHTPGPWQVESETYQRINSTEWWVTGSAGLADAFGIKVPTEADARLIAAAPDMLGALLQVRLWLNNGAWSDGEMADFPLFRQVQAAIAKATGND